MTSRLTAPQMAVLRALDKLPEGRVVTAKDGGFSPKSANSLWPRVFGSAGYPRRWSLLLSGRSLIAKLKAEGQW